MPVPIYLFTGFLDSGKTSLIKDTFRDEGFFEGEKSVLILCEDGETQYEEEFLKKYNTYMVTVNKKEELTSELFKKIEDFYHPDRIMLEFNGTWPVKEFMDSVKLPDLWLFAQVITTIDASTFNIYINAMRSVMYEQMLMADLIVCNRCDKSIKKSMLRGNIKAINKMAQIVYESVDGTVTTIQDEELPFDVSGDEIEIKDEDYGLWYMDFMDNLEKYEGKTVTLTGEVLRKGEQAANAFVVGRYAMVCCNNDTSMVAVLCESKEAKNLKEHDWVQIKAYIHLEYEQGYKDKIPVLAVREMKKVEPLADPLVYFN